ncbi:MAG TPA: zinc finger Ran-binding domain-containing protein [Candidatus Andersenbacteria bacterium]|nr:zinc finger Ran-binding domain-containing protein [Candidatus Andersenbacteria bacterium]
MPENEPAVTDSVKLAEARAGKNWSCSYCQSDNVASSPTCSQCGNGRSGGDTDRLKTDILLSAPSIPQVRETILISPRLIGICAGILLFSGMLLWWLLTPQSINVQLAFVSWERSIATEDYKTVREEDWSVPVGGRTVSQVSALHHYDQVLVGYETRTREVSEQVQVGTEEVVTGQRDMGNGYFEEMTSSSPVYETQYRTETYEEPVYIEEPVYKTKYTYDIDRWVTGISLTSSGQNDKPQWSDFKPTSIRREVKREGKYHATFQPLEENTKPILYTITDEKKWRQYQKGGVYVLFRNRLGIISRVEPLQKETRPAAR